ncbi:UNVERIFIED_CONTAM: hypothetical protein Scaly_0827700 [Sesamum calycinum]|uniref:Uncharacterized protein n=1 Tax=Sesamum calycinum TaxID=2727403 RepID=A0AAW2RBD7_9LAMI
MWVIQIELCLVVAGSGNSFIWRSILAARDLIVTGSHWQISNGYHVKIWTDRSIPSPITFQVITAPNTLSLQASVNELMREDGDWNEETVREIFRLEDVSAILAIPLVEGGQDCLR